MSTLNARMLYLYAITPIHSGVGQAASVIDLPIAREKSTGWPIIPSSTLKGVLRDASQDKEANDWINIAFGDQNRAGAIAFGDQRILCLPVRSYFGTFAYVTCPLSLTRLLRDANALAVEAPFPAEIPNISGVSVLLTSESVLINENKIYLEDLDLNRNEGNADAIATGLANEIFTDEMEKTGFVKRFVIVSDEVFNFLSETATEVKARISLKDDTKTVITGGLWYEEAVPAEAIFAGPILLTDHARRNGPSNLLDRIEGGLIQIGGHASVGCGLCRMVVGK